MWRITSFCSAIAATSAISRRWRLLPTRANAQTGFGLYRLNDEKRLYEGYGIQVVTFDGEQILDITTFRNPALMAAFGLPASLLA